MQLLNAPKLIVACLAMVAVTILAGLGRIPGESAVTVISIVLAYILGNGVAAIQGKPVQPIIGGKPPIQNTEPLTEAES